MREATNEARMSETDDGASESNGQSRGDAEAIMTARSADASGASPVPDEAGRLGLIPQAAAIIVGAVDDSVFAIFR